MYHTQEKWDLQITYPIICEDPEAWLGKAYYFWYTVDDAHYWGITMKRKRKYFEVYQAQINCDNLLDTVFNEGHYLFWLKNIEKALKRFAKANITASLTVINEYFKDNKIWTKFDGIMFQDIPTNPNKYVIPKFYYVKRIQVGVFNENIISNFVLRYDCVCT